MILWLLSFTKILIFGNQNFVKDTTYRQRVVYLLFVIIDRSLSLFKAKLYTFKYVAEKKTRSQLAIVYCEIKL